ncbi:hypothetical protein [Jiulongibacter sediminis]|uniref:Uncharacterized protein n=1 Tax=Jiulongibacter sediminis TaxID=1605367 RepID=A0A0P7BQZ6_9BACT|nr:hypothetical protein [Jiulongibacter sediminis]KPM46582.1 hypothetical protein AFM12_19185 [Jiulongibacter sediminis]TBX21155.1 hypothetical protein TK44_19190 [Jiulongibacter sediminis]
MEKKEMKCCMKSDSKSGHADQKCCCSSESASEHSDNQNHDDGCGDNCPDSGCHCSSFNHIAGIYSLTEELIETEISISFTTQFPEVNSSPKAAFISFWQPPKIG